MALSLTRKTEREEIPQFLIVSKINRNKIFLKVSYLKVKVRCIFKWNCQNINIQSKGRHGKITNPSPGVHNCSVTVRTASQSKTISVSVTKTSRPLKCAIKDGNREVGQSDKLRLRGFSEDPDDDKASFKYSWTCFYNDSGSTCILKSDSSTATFSETREIDVDISRIQTRPNEMLTFVLNIFKEKSSKMGESAVNITVKKGSPPVCKLKISIQAFDIRKHVKFSATIVSGSSLTKFFIGSVDEEDFAYLDIKNASSKSAEGEVKGLGRRKNHIMIINPNMLGYKSVYKFRLTCEDTDNATESHAEAELRTLSELTAGSITAEPKNGTAGDTTFTITMDNNWELSDEDSETSSEVEGLSVTYQCGWYYYDKGKKWPQTFGDSSNNDFCELQLPAGRKDSKYAVEVFFKVCVDDERKRCVENTTFVTVKPFSKSKDEEIEQAKRKVDEGVMSSDLEAIHSAVMIPELKDAPENVHQKIDELCEKSFEAGTKLIENDEIDDDSKTHIQEIFKKCAQSMQRGKLSESQKADVLDSATKIAEDKEESTDIKRKRRAVSEPVAMVTAKTPEQVELALQSHDILVNMSDYTVDTMDQKKQFIDLAKSLSRSMCNGIDNGEEARVAQLSTMVLRSAKNSFENVHINYSLTGCEQCETYKSKSAKVLLGQSLKSTYDDWNCDGDVDGCNGACVVSSQMVYDMLLNSTYKGVKRASDIIDVHLINPKTYQVLSVSSLATPVKYKIYMYNDTDMDKADLKCHRWDAGRNQWTTSDINTLSPNTADMSITCTADQLPYVTVFDLNGGVFATVETTAASTTATTEDGSTAESQESGMTARVTSTNAATEKVSSSGSDTIGTTKRDQTTSPSSGTESPTSTSDTSPSSTLDGSSTSSDVSSSSGTKDTPPTTKDTSPVSRTDGPSTSDEGIVTSKPGPQPNESNEKVLTFSIEENYDVVITSMEKKEQFESNMKKQLATKLRVQKSRIKDLSVKRGSIVVTFTLLPGNSNEPSVKELTDQLKKMVEMGNMTFTALDGKILSVMMSSFTKRHPTSKPTNNPNDNAKSGLKQEVFIGIIAGVCLVVLMVIVVGLYCRLKSKQRIKTCDDDSIKSTRSVQGVCNDIVEENKPPIDVTGINPSLPGSPVYDHVH